MIGSRFVQRQDGRTDLGYRKLRAFSGLKALKSCPWILGPIHLATDLASESSTLTRPPQLMTMTPRQQIATFAVLLLAMLGIIWMLNVDRTIRVHPLYSTSYSTSQPLEGSSTTQRLYEDDVTFFAPCTYKNQPEVFEVKIGWTRFKLWFKLPNPWILHHHYCWAGLDLDDLPGLLRSSRDLHQQPKHCQY